jgi:crossover junction endodeoxyribonuclease RuvC
MIVLGVDPGISFTGYGVVKGVGNHLSYITGGVIKTNPKQKFPERLKTIYEGLTKVIKEFPPDECSLENIFYCKNVKSALKLGHTRGVIMIAAANHGVSVHEYAPTEIKQAVTGHGRASKEQVYAMVRIILNIKSVAKLDTSDALAAAICHLNSSNFRRVLNK